MVCGSQRNVKSFIALQQRAPRLFVLWPLQPLSLTEHFVSLISWTAKKCLPRLADLGFNSYHRVYSWRRSKTDCFWASGRINKGTANSSLRATLWFHSNREENKRDISARSFTSDRRERDGGIQTEAVMAEDKEEVGLFERFSLQWFKVGIIKCI